MTAIRGELCGATRHFKRRYPDQESAEMALEDARRPRYRHRRARGKVESRVYECPSCGGWHLSSSPPPE